MTKGFCNTVLGAILSVTVIGDVQAAASALVAETSDKETVQVVVVEKKKEPRGKPAGGQTSKSERSARVRR